MIKLLLIVLPIILLSVCVFLAFTCSGPILYAVCVAEIFAVGTLVYGIIYEDLS